MGIVTIHVLDDSKSAQRDYLCEVKLLLGQMQYFASFLQDTPGLNVEVTVKCNIDTFEWLMVYIKTNISGISPVMDCSNCIPILIASSFLQMSELVKETVAFIATNIAKLAVLEAGIADLEGPLVTQIAEATPEESLEALLHSCRAAEQPNAFTHSSNSSSYSNTCSRLVQKLYKHKLELLLKRHQTTLMRCQLCQQLFSASGHKKLQCPAITGAATDRLGVMPLHQSDPSWTFREYLQQQRCRPQQAAQQQQQQQQQAVGQHRLLPSIQHHKQQAGQLHLQGAGSSWRDLFWLTWGHVTILYCQQCHQHFPARQYSQCSYHPSAAVFPSEAASGVYPCCGRPAWQPGMPLSHSQGCCAMQHQAAMQQHTSSGNCSGKHSQCTAGKQQQKKDLEAADSNALQVQAKTAEQAEQYYVARALELLQRFNMLIAVPYTPPPLPDQSTAVSTDGESGTAAAAGSSNSRQGSNSSCASSQWTVLPLLVRMTNRAKSGAHSKLSSAGGSTVTSTNYRASTSADVSGQPPHCVIPRAFGRSSSPTLSAAETDSSGGDAEAEISDHDDGRGISNQIDKGFDSLSGSLGHRSTQLRSSLAAVRSAAQAHNRGSSLVGIGSGMTAAKLAAEVGVPLGATFSSGGTRNLGRQTMFAGSHAGGSGTNALQSQTSLLASSRQQTWHNTSMHGPVQPSSSNSRPSSRLGPRQSTVATHSSSGNVGWPSRTGGILSDSRPSSPLAVGSGALADQDTAAAAAGGRNSSPISKLNRTLLLELVHEDDMYRMGLLMRKLDSLRLQPPPDGKTSSFRPLSAEQVSQALNGVIFDGLQRKVAN